MKKMQTRIWFPECEAMLAKWWATHPPEWVRDKLNEWLRIRAIREGYADWFTASINTLENRAVKLGLVSEGEVRARRANARKIPKHVKKRILRKGRCKYCQSTRNLVVDHIVPVAQGGTSKTHNLQCLCADCNLAKGARLE